jgi:demethylmenaquinone methyltransferase/2-methoxy-6-polyprenyl-1,4-benzoquinol methylase
LFAGLPRRYDLLAEVFSFGQNRRWRRRLVARIDTPATGRVLDVATGTAGVAIAVARTRPVVVVGLDQSAPMLTAGRHAIDRAALVSRVCLVLGRGEQLPFADGSFDAVTFTYLLRYVDEPSATLAELSRVLRSGGTLVGLEFHVPPRAPLRTLWWLYTRVGLPLAGRAVSKSWYEVGRFLGPSISDFYKRHPLEKQLAWWRAADIDNVRAQTMSLGGGVVIWGTKKGGVENGC